MNREFIIDTIQLSPFYNTLSDQETDFLIQKILDAMVLEPPSLKEVMYPQ